MPEDISLIAAWGQSVTGRAIDTRSGPGHWTELLRAQGVDISGIDLVPEFIASARERFPRSRYCLGSVSELPTADGELGGILAWYSLIHSHPDETTATLREFSRVLRPGGSLLVSAFQGAQASTFDHAIVEAYYWSVEDLRHKLEETGFSPLETHTRTAPDTRPHLAIVAERKIR
ncbi:class I SAM-dependent methyltransferase [Lysinibacter sp. HNR]|uniref:class I SAM-dependent methyltransferase n=1 Tax=Lysinibacter sp. HNR TaxID=3031408 RepID=UPI0024352086|nr:class I SAM-dependent methyltransferase [Lysinibacter sp. HNR]WGD37178.1 class I SAM-dependent methyltransferase [Lysinibacter sp. HNR]